jgi:hypothetical protein
VIIRDKTGICDSRIVVFFISIIDGDKSFTTFTHERSTMIKSTSFENVFAARYPPYNQDKYNIFSALVYGLPSSIVGKVQTINTFFGSTLRFLSGSSSIESQKDN